MSNQKVMWDYDWENFYVTWNNLLARYTYFMLFYNYCLSICEHCQMSKSKSSRFFLFGNKFHGICNEQFFKRISNKYFNISIKCNHKSCDFQILNIKWFNKNIIIWIELSLFVIIVSNIIIIEGNNGNLNRLLWKYD